MGDRRREASGWEGRARKKRGTGSDIGGWETGEKPGDTREGQENEWNISFRG